MAQTTGQLPGTEFKLEVSDDGGSTWTDISGSVTSVAPSGGERQYGKTYTAEGNKPVMAYGKDNELTHEVVIVYTETAGEAYETCRAIVENRDIDVQLRWSPGGGDSGDEQYTTDDGAIVSPLLPPVDASDANPVTISFTHVCTDVTKSTVT